jgi:hypothetical protein
LSKKASIFKVGLFQGDKKVVTIEEDEKVIGIKAQTVSDLTRLNHGAVCNLQF